MKCIHEGCPNPSSDGSSVCEQHRCIGIVEVVVEERCPRAPLAGRALCADHIGGPGPGGAKLSPTVAAVGAGAAAAAGIEIAANLTTIVQAIGSLLGPFLSYARDADRDVLRDQVAAAGEQLDELRRVIEQYEPPQAPPTMMNASG